MAIPSPLPIVITTSRMFKCIALNTRHSCPRCKKYVRSRTSPVRSLAASEDGRRPRPPNPPPLPP